MEPPAKKQKTSDSTEDLKPIVFPYPGQRPDVRLTVFDQEFHVHSTLLKLNSGFFRTFLDSPDKVVSDAAKEPVNSGSSSIFRSEASRIGWSETTNFKYDWVTKIDEDGTWWLVADNPKNHPYNLEAFNGDKTEQTMLFHVLLRAMYFQFYDIPDAQFLLDLTALADFFRALPIISRTLDGALVNSPDFVRSIRQYSTKLFVAAAKLRNALLFRECLIWVVSPHGAPVYRKLMHSHRKLYRVAQCAYSEIAAEVMAIMGAVLVRTSVANPLISDQESGLIEFQRDVGASIDQDSPIAEGQKAVYPKLFRSMLNRSYLGPLESEAIEEILQTERVLEQGHAVAGEGDCRDSFLCAYISNEDLPWDITETDW